MRKQHRRCRNKRAGEIEKTSHQMRLLTKKNEKNLQKLAKITRNCKKLAKNNKN
jgi:hypothetical protein